MFRQPAGIDIYSDPPEVLNVAPLNAGDCVSARSSAQPRFLSTMTAVSYARR